MVSQTLFVMEPAASEPCVAVLYHNDSRYAFSNVILVVRSRLALDWCILNRAGMVFTLASSPERN